ncbi:hypothetical protein BGW80DRAFT_216845 [Lactifluus volemus]|nr:hypothetical protein BGW80DRAFT_216845 [Lactifluus volemus]
MFQSQGSGRVKFDRRSPLACWRARTGKAFSNLLLLYLLWAAVAGDIEWTHQIAECRVMLPAMSIRWTSAACAGSCMRHNIYSFLVPSSHACRQMRRHYATPDFRYPQPLPSFWGDKRPGGRNSVHVSRVRRQKYCALSLYRSKVIDSGVMT